MEVKLFKSETIKFEENFDKNRQEIYDAMIDILAYRKAINSIHILPNWADAINESIVGKVIVKSIHGTLAIEGNTASEKENKEILTEKIDVDKIKERNKQETYNIIKACDLIKQIGKRGADKARLKLSENMIKEIHKVITLNTNENGNIPGNYRNFPVEAGDSRFGGIYMPPKILDDIKISMSVLIEWLNSDEMLTEYSIFRVILAHYYLAIIHPFADGNGRTARAIESLILYNHDYKYGTSFALWRYYYENYDEYFSLLSKTRKENQGIQTDFIVFVLKLLRKALHATHTSIIEMIDQLLFNDYISYLLKKNKISKRQNAIISYMMGLPNPINEKNISLENPVIQGFYKGLGSKVRLFQMDMQKIVSSLALFKKIKKDNEEYYNINLDLISKSE